VVTGELLINGQPVEPTHVKSLSGLVFQDDLILQTMTVREALTMAAILRLPAAMSMDERLSRVEEVIQMLKLEKSADVVVGDSEVKGISGGERKRLSVGMELINNPYLLFLDEFSSGLDTFTARKVGEILKELAQSGRTIVSTIHQPSAELFFMFDDLLLLAEGQTLYFGPTTGVISYFERLGHKIPA
jgi:ABC-type multidrug transport system ATPase subunit